MDMVIIARELFGSPIFRKIIIVASRAIWSHRNSIIFYGASSSFASWRQTFFEEMSLKDKINIWLSSL
ncbi:hypothetical protein HU200_033602 [Digitaria exilis]|uniref:Uncharacterized protein n=1 Tax=Digitaria exilis TaxID=1010633 RepID=A0A835BKV8_9POAL|nr:hypothetical protein HU200_033602 [Digitaria exilis]